MIKNQEKHDRYKQKYLFLQTKGNVTHLNAV